MESETTRSNPTVWIVTPCYNAAEFIGRTIESVRQQQLPTWQHMVVDDGSSDDSRAIVERIVGYDSRVKLISQPNAGVHAARNNGAAQAVESSQYLVFLDADDMLEPNFLSTMVDHMDRHPEVGLAYCSYHLVDADGGALDKDPSYASRYVPAGFGVRTLGDDEPETPLESLVSRHEAIPSTAILRRSTYQRTSGWRRSGVIEDKDMVMQMALVAPVHYVPMVMTAYRQHDANRSSTTLFASLEELHRRWWHNSDLDEQDLDAVRRAITFDKRLSARFERRHAMEAFRERRLVDAAISGGRALKRDLETAVLALRRRAGRLVRSLLLHRGR